MESVFTFLFKYRPFLFQRGDFSFQWGMNLWTGTLLVLIVAALGFLIYRQIQAGLPGRRGWVLLSIRCGFFLLLLLLTMKPALVLSRLVPKENLLAVLADNSRSLGISGEDQEPRGRPVQDLLKEDSSFLKALDERFYLRLFRFDSSAQRGATSLDLDFTGDQTNIVSGLERVLTETKNLPLAGIVLLSDGSDNSFRDFQSVLDELKTRQIPVHSVGVGPESLDRDVEITGVSMPRVALPETVSGARVTFRHSGFGGSRGRLEVREGNSLVETQEVSFPRDSETFTTDVRIAPKSEGTLTYHFTLVPLEGEEIEENNSRTAVMQVRDLGSRVLYVEGQPRWEYKFIRRALTDDKHLRLVTLLRTALNKYYRQGIEEETTLATGFPTQREELFQFQGLIFGSVESSFFSYQQLEMVRDFVSQRGGGFLMLGGGSSFGSGQFQNTPIEEILPVWLQQDDGSTRPDGLYEQGEGRLTLTQQGRLHPALQMSMAVEENDKIWDQVPVIRDWNVVKETKSGATVLARLGEGLGNQPSEDSPPLMVFQRYGRGHSLAFLTGGSWQWQMLLPHEDQTHETFWRQVLRWLVNSAKDPIHIETERPIYSRNEIVKLQAQVSDKAFTRINDARVEATVTSPSGKTWTLPLEWDTRQDGVYQGEWVTEEEGFHSVSVAAEGETLGEDQVSTTKTSFLTSTGSREFFDPVQKSDFLQKLSEETGGRYYPLREAGRIPEEILYSQSQTSVVEVLDLWDMPFNLLLLLALLFSEWVMRKQQGYI